MSSRVIIKWLETYVWVFIIGFDGFPLPSLTYKISLCRGANVLNWGMLNDHLQKDKG